jgi:PAP2 superfamily
MKTPARRFAFHLAAALLCAWLPCGPAAAAGSFHLFDPATPVAVGGSGATEHPTSLGPLFASDLRQVATSPARLGPRGWLATALVVGVLGARLAAERGDVDAEVPEGSAGQRQAAGFFEPLGETGSIAVLGGFLLGGAVGHDARAKEVAIDGAIASLIAGGLITPAIKGIAGRSRPHQAASGTDFHPFGGHASFPSGHTTQAFAVASVIATEYDRRWIAVAAYGSAALVGYARVLHDAHYLSDVVAGALVGTLVGRAVVRTNQRLRGERVTVAPALGRDRAGVAVDVRLP